MMTPTSVDASAAAGPSRFRSMFTFWKKREETPATVTGDASCNPTGHPDDVQLDVIQPPAVHVAVHHVDGTSYAVDDFFGARGSGVDHPTTVSAPPPYAPYGHEVIETRPGVYSVQEPPTLARALFIYGFLFFPFWLAGIYILFSPLLPTEDWESGKSEAEKAELLYLLRETEKKWARRCMWAFCGLILGAILLAVIIKYGFMAPI